MLTQSADFMLTQWGQWARMDGINLGHKSPSFFQKKPSSSNLLLTDEVCMYIDSLVASIDDEHVKHVLKRFYVHKNMLSEIYIDKKKIGKSIAEKLRKKGTDYINDAISV